MVMITPERVLEESLVKKLRDLKYEDRPKIRDRATLEANFREKFEALNRVKLTDGEFQRLLEEIVTPDVYEAASTTVPIATGWNDSCRVGVSPAERTRLSRRTDGRGLSARS